MLKIKISFLFFAIVLCFSCQNDEIKLPPANDELVFPATLPLSIIQDVSTDGSIFFTMQPEQVELLFISIFTSPPVVFENELVNIEDQIWSFLGPSPSDGIIRIDDGSVINGGAILDPVFFQCYEEELYWAAWGWDNTAQVITRSSKKNLVLVSSSVLPSLVLSQIAKVGETPSDTLLVPGGDITLRFDFRNNGAVTANDIMLRITQPAIADFPLTFNYSSIPAGELVSQTITFTIPSDLSFGDTIRLLLEVSYNDCLDYSTEIELIINALSVCLFDVRLIDIRYLPPAIFWDPGALPIFWDPDVYYQLFGPGNNQLFQSITVQDAADDFPNTPVLADWPDLTPCIELNLDSTYLINFWDEDALDPDDFIGTVSFLPLDYITTQDTMVTITNNEVMMELYFRWE
jgi:hypothetical protein